MTIFIYRKAHNFLVDNLIVEETEITININDNISVEIIYTFMTDFYTIKEW